MREVIQITVGSAPTVVVIPPTKENTMERLLMASLEAPCPTTSTYRVKFPLTESQERVIRRYEVESATLLGSRRIDFITHQQLKLQLRSQEVQSLTESDMELPSCASTVNDSDRAMRWANSAYRLWQAASDQALSEVDYLSAPRISPAECVEYHSQLARLEIDVTTAFAGKLIVALGYLHPLYMRNPVEAAKHPVAAAVRECIRLVVSDSLSTYRNFFEAKFLSTATAGQSKGAPPPQTEAELFSSLENERQFAVDLLHASTVEQYLDVALVNKMKAATTLLPSIVKEKVQHRDPSLTAVFIAARGDPDCFAKFCDSFLIAVEAELFHIAEGVNSIRFLEIVSEFQSLIERYCSAAEPLLKLLLKAAQKKLTSASVSSRDISMLIDTVVRSIEDGTRPMAAAKDLLRATFFATKKYLANDASNFCDLLSEGALQRFYEVPSMVLPPVAPSSSSSSATTLGSAMCPEGAHQFPPVVSVSKGGAEKLRTTVAGARFVEAEKMLLTLVRQYFDPFFSHKLHLLSSDYKDNLQLEDVFRTLFPGEKAAEVKTLRVKVVNAAASPAYLTAPLPPLLTPLAEQLEMVGKLLFPRRKLNWLPTVCTVTVQWRHQDGSSIVTMNAVHLAVLQQLEKSEESNTKAGGNSRTTPLGLDGLSAALQVTAATAQRHVTELLKAGLLQISKDATQQQSHRLVDDESHSVLEISSTCDCPRFRVGSRGRTGVATAAASGSSTKQGSSSRQDRIRRAAAVDSAIVRLLKQKGTVQLPLQPHLSAGSLGPLTTTEVAASIDRLHQREFLRKVGTSLEYIP